VPTLLGDQLLSNILHIGGQFRIVGTVAFIGQRPMRPSIPTQISWTPLGKLVENQGNYVWPSRRNEHDVEEKLDQVVAP